MVEEGGKLEDALWKADNMQIAFADKGDEQQRWINAAEYSDELAPGFRAWYVCMAGCGTGWPRCGTLISSKCWDTFHKDPAASKQRWYCGCCGAKYRTTFGLLSLSAVLLRGSS